MRNGRNAIRLKLYKKLKRLVDVAASAAGIVLLSPVLLGISAAIRADSKGPVIFRQKRIGIHKSYFYIYKFRTMYVDTPKDMPTHMLQNPDAMVTKAGRILRKYSLDELPQLFNILKGDMSIVGPRPALWNQYDLMAERDKYGANDVLPGLTGWAQINGRDELEIPVKAKLDGYYVKHMGVLMDLRCLIGTVAAVAGHRGVVEGGTGELHRQEKNVLCDKKTENLVDGGKRILITGAHSYVGTSMEAWLARFPGRYHVEMLDMHGDAWRSVDFKGYDAVFHVAGIAHADIGRVTKQERELYVTVNRDLAVETAKKAKEAGVRQFIFMSSMIVYGDSAPPGVKKRITKDTKPRPSNFYGYSKWQADCLVRQLETSEFKVCVLRPPMIYGKGSKGNYPALSKLARKMPIFPMLQNERSMLYIDNLCEFVRLMVDQEEHGIFFPQNAEYGCTSEMVAMIAKAHGRRMPLVRALAPGVKFAAGMPGKVGQMAYKAFGNFSYDQEMSGYEKGNYRICSLSESIRRTESDS